VIGAQITDLTLMAPGKLAYGRVDTAPISPPRSALSTARAAAVRRDHRRLADRGDPEAIVSRGAAVSREAPYYVIPGNHAGHADSRRAFVDHNHLRRTVPSSSN